MERLTINPAHILCVEAILEKENPSVKFKKEKRLLGLKIRGEGYYFNPGEIEVSQGFLKRTCFIKNNKVYCKPHLVISYTNKQDRTVYFETEEELWIFYNKHFKDWTAIHQI